MIKEIFLMTTKKFMNYSIYSRRPSLTIWLVRINFKIEKFMQSWDKKKITKIKFKVKRICLKISQIIASPNWAKSSSTTNKFMLRISTKLFSAFYFHFLLHWRERCELPCEGRWETTTTKMREREESEVKANLVCRLSMNIKKLDFNARIK